MAAPRWPFAAVAHLITMMAYLWPSAARSHTAKSGRGSGTYLTCIQTRNAEANLRDVRLTNCYELHACSTKIRLSQFRSPSDIYNWRLSRGSLTRAQGRKGQPISTLEWRKYSLYDAELRHAKRYSVARPPARPLLLLLLPAASSAVGSPLIKYSPRQHFVGQPLHNLKRGAEKPKPT